MVALHPDDDRPATMDCFTQSRVMQVIGGETRSDSVLAALRALAGVAERRDWVLVHDAARPCVAATEIVNLHARVSSSGVGGILAEPIVDTVKQATEEERVLRTLDRTVLWRAQTPQMFRLGLLQSALEDALVAGAVVTDDLRLVSLPQPRRPPLPFRVPGRVYEPRWHLPWRYARRSRLPSPVRLLCSHQSRAGWPFSRHASRRRSPRTCRRDLVPASTTRRHWRQREDCCAARIWRTCTWSSRGGPGLARW